MLFHYVGPFSYIQNPLVCWTWQMKLKQNNSINKPVTSTSSASVHKSISVFWAAKPNISYITKQSNSDSKIDVQSSFRSTTWTDFTSLVSHYEGIRESARPHRACAKQLLLIHSALLVVVFVISLKWFRYTVKMGQAFGTTSSHNGERQYGRKEMGTCSCLLFTVHTSSYKFFQTYECETVLIRLSYLAQTSTELSK